MRRRALGGCVLAGLLLGPLAPLAALARPPEPSPPPADLVPYPETWAPFVSTPSPSMPLGHRP